MDIQTDDIQLIQAVQQGNKQAFDILVLKYQYRATKVVAKYINDPVEVLDITQESFLKAYKAIHSFQFKSSFFTWICRIVINTAKNYLLGKGRKIIVNHGDFDDLEQLLGSTNKCHEAPEYHVIAAEIEESLQSAINQLPYELKTAITLRELEGMSYDDIAKIMCCPVGTIRSRIFRARETLSKNVMGQN